MDYNNLTSIAAARPIIYAEGLFASCYLDNGKFIPEDGLRKTDLWSILNGEFLKTGSDLVEDFTLKGKLRQLHSINNETYELDQFPRNCICSLPTCNLSDDVSSLEKDREEIQVDGIPLVQISLINEEDSLIQEGTSEELEIRKSFEKQVSWIMGEDGEEFVTMETFTRSTDALILLDVLKKQNIPSVVSFLARRDEPIAITFSKIQIGLDCLMFCLFQA